MQRNYKRLGDFIRLVDERNRKLEVTTLLGVSVSKHFMPSIANTFGTDFTKYKIVKRNQFTYISDTSRRGEKIGLALLENYDEVLVSQAYTVFKITDESRLLPQYLMLWFKRPEFDRFARFKSHGSVREIFDWEEMCNVELPVPSIEKQREMVTEYQAVEDRIRLNNALCQKLEDTAQTLYRHWFEDFEFPHSRHCEERGTSDEAILHVAESQSSYNKIAALPLAMTGYKSSGGKMVHSEELGKDIPEGWRVGKLGEVILNFDSQRKPITSSDRIKGKYPYYGAAALMDYVKDYIYDGTYILLGEDGSVINSDGSPVLQYVWGKIWVNNHAHVLKGTNGYDDNSLYLLLRQTNVSEIVTGGVQAKINQTNLNNLKILIPCKNVLLEFNLVINPLFEKIKKVKTQTQKLEELKSLLLGKMAVAEA